VGSPWQQQSQSVTAESKEAEDEEDEEEKEPEEERTAVDVDTMCYRRTGWTPRIPDALVKIRALAWATHVERFCRGGLS
jgi:phosphoglycerate dehydrogenase-like enzyme